MSPQRQLYVLPSSRKYVSSFFLQLVLLCALFPAICFFSLSLHTFFPLFLERFPFSDGPRPEATVLSGFQASSQACVEARPQGSAPGPSNTPPVAPGPYGSNRKLQQTQAQVDEVVDIMRVNVDRVLERDQKLTELDDRADALQAGASQFETSAAKLKRKYWWKNCKMWAILIAVILIIIIIIIVWQTSS
ncbi:vesicle-associated membrane protein 3-like [Pristis pectinata]|uniref:vesicle-associated membrane protein 3-like n=1 Tax=Pristis pectinata TaxID=685728 RepID=UPI00223CEB19|nr:vesicle-associated membrane protein 3-like [Pristis pectinata]